MADDIITKLPVDPIFRDISLNGWWHVGTEILLNETGNMLIRPSPIERFMFQKTLGKPSSHLRMTYATALMLWSVRSHPEYEPDWWLGVITLFYKNSDKRLKPVPQNLRERLLFSLLKPGVRYQYRNRLVRDMAVASSENEIDVETLITQLLVSYRERNSNDFNDAFQALSHLREDRKIFVDGKAKRKQIELFGQQVEAEEEEEEQEEEHDHDGTIV